MQSRRLSFRLLVPAVVICCLVTLLGAVPAAAQSKSGSDGSGDDETLWSLMPPWVRDEIAHIERLRAQGAATGEAVPGQLESDREALLSFARLYVRVREQGAATGEAAPGHPAAEPDGSPPERQPLDPATEARTQDSEREALLGFARGRVAVGDSPEQVRQAVEEEIRRRAEEARKDLSEWERRRGDAGEDLGKAVKAFEGERSPVGTYPAEEPFDRVIRTSAWVTIVKEKVEAAEARSRVTDANAARAPDLAQEIAEQIPPRPERTLADDEIDDLVAFARKRLDEGMPGAEVVEAVQAHIDDRAEKARAAVEHWADQADAEARGDGAPSESATASRHTAWERRFLTEANAADPGFASVRNLSLIHI